ncbi:hypothetical protein D3C87_1945050 [compost metagenome]
MPTLPKAERMRSMPRLRTKRLLSRLTEVEVPKTVPDNCWKALEASPLPRTTTAS